MRCCVSNIVDQGPAERQHKPALECPQCAVVTVTGIFGWEHRSEKFKQTQARKDARSKQEKQTIKGPSDRFSQDNNFSF